MSEALTIKQENFCQAYLLLGNASAAYREAYEAEDMKNEVIHVKACELLKNGKVSVRIAELRKEVFKRNKATIDEVLSIASDMLRADIAEAYDEDGSLKNIKDIPKNLRMAITGLDTDEIKTEGVKIGETKKLKLSDRNKVLDLFMKHLGGYEKHNEQQTTNVTVFKLPDNGRG